MNGPPNRYAVFLFPQAIEALGDAIKPYLQEGPAGAHVVCHGIDTAGSLIEMSLSGATNDGQQVELELMIPSGMVRMVVSAHSDEAFGFGPHALRAVAQPLAPAAEASPPAAPAQSPSQTPDATPQPAEAAPADRRVPVASPAPSAIAGD